MGVILGDIFPDNFPNSTLRADASKGGIYRVYITVPKELRKFYGKTQLRKSTGEKDLKRAVRKQHEITEGWYRQFREHLGSDPYTKLISSLGLQQHVYAIRFKDDYEYDLDFRSKPEDVHEAEAALKAIKQRIREYKTARENRNTSWFISSGILETELLSGKRVELDDILLLYQEVEANFHQRFCVLEKNTDAQTKTLGLKGSKLDQSLPYSPKLNEFLKAYSEHRIWDGKAKRGKKSSFSRILRCIEIIGDVPVNQVKRHHALVIAETLEAKGLANKTIRSYISALSGLLKYVRDFEIPDPEYQRSSWISDNPLRDMPLAMYGEKTRSYEALTEAQLMRLFAQDMTPRDRLCLELLVTTGCRLNEIALLTWEQIKVDSNDIRFIDLASEARVKNKNSARLVPIPDIVELPERSKGRVFDYPLDEYGNAAKHAGDHLRERYIYKIRDDEKDDRKTVHSLRHNMVGFLDNLVPPVPENVKDWITGHRAEHVKNDSERKRTYGSDPDLVQKFDALNRIKHPWLTRKRR